MIKNFQFSIFNFQYKKNLQLTTYLPRRQAGNLRPNCGFTLIEILVTATIIGILSTIGLSGYQTVTRSSRNALRKTDLEQIRSGLEIYKSENSAYPASSGCASTVDLSSYISPYPADPKSPTYRYCYLRLTSLTYQLCAHLENGGAGDTGCGGGNQCTGNCNYQVTNP